MHRLARPVVAAAFDETSFAARSGAGGRADHLMASGGAVERLDGSTWTQGIRFERDGITAHDNGSWLTGAAWDLGLIAASNEGVLSRAR